MSVLHDSFWNLKQKKKLKDNLFWLCFIRKCFQPTFHFTKVHSSRDGGTFRHDRVIGLLPKNGSEEELRTVIKSWCIHLLRSPLFFFTDVYYFPLICIRTWFLSVVWYTILPLCVLRPLNLVSKPRLWLNETVESDEEREEKWCQVRDFQYRIRYSPSIVHPF